MIRIYVQEFFEEKRKRKYEVEHEAGRQVLDRALKEDYGVESYIFERKPQGKPWLPSHPEIYFNISHSGNLAVCAVGESPLGVDIERVRPFKDNLLRKVLSYQEQEMFEKMEMSEEERQKLFFRLWTLKESFVKADGCGIRIPLGEVSFSFEQGGQIRCNQNQYSFWQKELENGFVISLCWKGGNQEEILLN